MYFVIPGGSSKGKWGYDSLRAATNFGLLYEKTVFDPKNGVLPATIAYY
jgi:hypothetical protein